jgi:hypothetical protein
MGHRNTGRVVREQQRDTVAREGREHPGSVTTPRYHHIVEHGATLRAERDALWAYIRTLEDELRTWGIPWGEVLLTSGPMMTIDERIGELRRQHGLVQEALPGPSGTDSR